MFTVNNCVDVGNMIHVKGEMQQHRCINTGGIEIHMGVSQCLKVRNGRQDLDKTHLKSDCDVVTELNMKM